MYLFIVEFMNKFMNSTNYGIAFVFDFVVFTGYVTF